MDTSKMTIMLWKTAESLLPDSYYASPLCLDEQAIKSKEKYQVKIPAFGWMVFQITLGAFSDESTLQVQCK